MSTEREHSSAGSLCSHAGHGASGPEFSCSVLGQQEETGPCSPAEVQSPLNVSRWENPGLLSPWGLIHSQGCKHYTSPLRFIELWDLEAVRATCPVRYYHVHNIVQNQARVFIGIFFSFEFCCSLLAVVDEEWRKQNMNALTRFLPLKVTLVKFYLILFLEKRYLSFL